MPTLIPTDRIERLEEHQGFAFKVTSYRLGDQFLAQASNVSPDAVIARGKAPTREEAEASVVEAARRRLGRTRVRDLEG